MTKKDLRLFGLILFIVEGSIFGVSLLCIKGFPFLPPVVFLDETKTVTDATGTISFFGIGMTSHHFQDGLEVRSSDGRQIAVQPTGQKIEFSQDGVEYEGVGLGSVVLTRPASLIVRFRSIDPEASRVRIAFQRGGFAKFVLTMCVLVVISLGLSAYLFHKMARKFAGPSIS